jgi:hypothetical protein
MKKTLNYILKTFIIVLILSITYSLEAQVAPPPPPGGADGTGNNSDNSQGGAPIGGGLFILLGLGAAYGGKKLYDLRKEKLEE